MSTQCSLLFLSFGNSFVINRLIQTTANDSLRLWSADLQLPTLNRDETLYSWLGRIRLLNGNPNATELSERLFGCQSSALAHDFPSRLSHLSQNNGVSHAPEELAGNHTVLGYYLPWFTQEKIDLALESAVFGSIPDIKMRLGIPATRLGKHTLKGCKSCMLSQESTVGYPYWRTYHQYPSVWICDVHLEPLVTYQSIRTFRHERRWIRPQDIDLSRVRNSEPASAIRETLLRLTRLSIAASRFPNSFFQQEKLRDTYRQALRQQGHVTRNNRLRMRPFLKRVMSTYGSLLEISEFRVIESLSDDWAGFVGDATRDPSRQLHPMKHLMLINVLFSSWNRFFACYSFDSVKHEAPIVKRKPAADSRHEIFAELVTSDGLSISAAGRQVGVSATTAVRWAKLQGLAYTPRTKRITESVLDRCRRQLTRGDSKQNVAERNAISMVSVTRLLSSEPLLREQWRDAIHRKRLAEYRREFEALLQRNPGVPLRLLRKLPRNRYMWLYRHDRDWLTETLSRFGWDLSSG